MQPPANKQYSLIACGAYYWLWAYLIPKWRGYKLRQEVIHLENGAQSNQLRKVPKEKVAEWDATHDVAGREIEPLEEAIQVQGKNAESSSDDGVSFAHGAKSGDITIKDTSYV